MKKSIMIWLSCLSSCLCLQCSQTPVAAARPATAYDSILDYFSSRQKKELSRGCKRLFVLTENGCVSCNKNFFDLIKTNVSDPGSAFLFGTGGAYLDISGLDSLRNVYIDQSILETDYALFHDSKVIFLKPGGIDTIINISADGLQEQFELIGNRR